MKRDANELVLEEVCVRMGGFSLDRVSFTIPPGVHFVLVGPPGSGKTVTAETICGLNTVRSGRVLLAGKDLTALDPGRRSIGYVPQDYALLPQRDVQGNLALGLEARGLARSERRRRVAEVAGQLGIAHLLTRRVPGLSGGEKQRVAFARALAFTPDLLVLDEPVSALDANTRDTLLELLNHIQRDEGITTLHICHNFEEMMTAADVVGVISGGRIEQVGPRDEVVRRPATPFVAEFLQARNIFPVDVRPAGTVSELRIGPVTLTVPRRIEHPVFAVVRPENVMLVPGSSRNAGRVTSVTDVGRTVELDVEAGPTWHASMGKGDFLRTRLTVGDAVGIEVPPEAVHVIRADDVASKSAAGT